MTVLLQLHERIAALRGHKLLTCCGMLVFRLIMMVTTSHRPFKLWRAMSRNDPTAHALKPSWA